MPNNKAKVQDELPPEWMSEEASRAKGQGEAGKLVNETAASRRRATPPVKHAPRERVLKDLVAWIIPKDALSSCFSTLGITWMPHKFNAARRHKFDKAQYRVIQPAFVN